MTCCFESLQSFAWIFGSTLRSRAQKIEVIKPLYAEIVPPHMIAQAPLTASYSYLLFLRSNHLSLVSALQYSSFQLQVVALGAAIDGAFASIVWNLVGCKNLRHVFLRFDFNFHGLGVQASTPVVGYITQHFFHYQRSVMSFFFVVNLMGNVMDFLRITLLPAPTNPSRTCPQSCAPPTPWPPGWDFRTMCSSSTSYNSMIHTWNDVKVCKTSENMKHQMIEYSSLKLVCLAA